MKLMTNKKKALLTAAVLLALSSGEAFAETYEGVTQTVTKSNATMDELYANSKAAVTVTGSGTISFTPNSNTSGERTMGAVYADNNSKVYVGSATNPYTSITANGEVLAEDESTVELYGTAITIKKTNNTAAVSSDGNSNIQIIGVNGTSKTSSIETKGEVLASGGTVTMQAEDITMGYSASANNSSASSGGEDHTAMADEKGKLTITAGNKLIIDGPVGARDSGSSVVLQGKEINISHNTLTTVKEDPESRGVYAEDGGTVTIGSDDTDTLTIDVKNSSDDSSIVVSGGASKLELYGKTISVTAEDGIYNGDLTGELHNQYEGVSLVMGSDSTDSLIVNGTIRTAGSDASTKLLGSSIAVNDRAEVYNGGSLAIGSARTESVKTKGLVAERYSDITVLGHTITVGGAEDYLDEDEDNVSIHVTYNGNVNIGDDDTDTVQIPGKIILGDIGESDLIVRGNEIRIGTNGETNDIRIFESLTGSKCSIGDENTESVIMTGLLSNGGQSVLTIIGDTVTLEGNVYNFNTESFLTVYGTTISLTSDKALEEEYPYTVIAADGGVMTLGSSRTESLTIVGMVASLVEGDPGTKVSLDGSAITLQNGAVATGNGAALTIGSAGVTKTLTGDLTATDKGVVTATLSGTYTGDAVASDAGTLSLRAGAAEGNLTSTGSGSTLTADVSGAMTGTSTASDGGTLTLTSGSVAGNLTSTGSGSTLTATVSGAAVGDASAAESGNLTLTTGSLTGDLTTSDSGTLAATVSHTFTGKTTDDADTMTLTLSSGATWNLTDSSTVSTLNAEGGLLASWTARWVRR